MVALKNKFNQSAKNLCFIAVQGKNKMTHDIGIGVQIH